MGGLMGKYSERKMVPNLRKETKSADKIKKPNLLISLTYF